ncbi:UDP-N-acetylglucosamine--N-acetylmuramyl-(pentapeptide) pyrophosphoryl-undecaprenol N-acetylglucosamine transferase [bioreactor metagenome]|uniref:UDP-N-acetylglucosamine--N-acetylmuramyl-(Pentapeptide) pyrophosphoryl-undecaprenol N-acetylglucosamine transferase n=1 Tax=bioreactor metagenome TaxID=1076179 RepID=A0A645C928_9ZZZZ
MKKILVAAGGTGGHLFPAVAVIEKLKEFYGNEIDFHFFGRSDKIEARVVPQMGYKLHTTKLTGLVKIASLNTVKLPFQILASVIKLRKIIKEENIDAVLCAGAYLSYPAGLAASICKKKLFLMESNVNPGKAINLLANRADIIFTTFDDTKKYFHAKNLYKIKNYGNPVRKQILNSVDKNIAFEKFNLDENKPVVLIFGGSLGANAINKTVLNSLEQLATMQFQVIWQTGTANKIDVKLPPNVRIVDFIDDMASAYSVADLVVSRSGATTVAELTVLGKPAILIPLPSASNNEQFFNAKFLEKNDAAIIINNSDIPEHLLNTIKKIINDSALLQKMSESSNKLGHPDASSLIAQEIVKNI